MKKVLNLLLLCLIVLPSCDMKEPDNALDTKGKIPVQLPVAENAKQAWLPGDKLLIHGENSADQALVTLTERDITADGKTCYVSVEGVAPYVQEGVESQYAIAYPGELVKNAKTPKDKNKFTATNALLMSGYQAGGEFVFEYLVGGWAFTVQGDFDSYVLKGNNNDIVGYETVTCCVTESVKKYVQSTGSSLTLISGSVKADGTTVNHICFTPETSMPLGFELTFYKGETPVKVLYTEEGYTSARTVFTDLGNITSALEDYKAPIADTHVSAIPTKGAVDLGSAATANCYVVNEPGVYTFKAVKGNSTEPLASIGSVEVLWETWGTTETVTPNSVIAQVDFEKDMVYFRVDENYHPGNAVIAAKNDKGVITWSWHIWMPETAISEDYHKLSKRTTMSRNLGALVDASVDGASAKSTGLFYQWGRKDPFVAVADFSTGAPASVSGKAMTKAGAQLSVTDAIKNPTVFADYNGNWTTNGEALWGSTKTMYDPCPPGYRVPYTSEYLPLSYGPDELDGWVYDGGNNIFTIGNPDAVYPLGGYLSCDGNYCEYGSSAYIWSSRGSSGAAFNFAVTSGDNGMAYDNSTKKNANGYSVRCMAEEFTPAENAPGTPVKGDYTRFDVTVRELSGLCLHTDKSFLWGVGDQGNLIKIGFDGVVENVLSKGWDMESITIDPSTNDLYIGCEPNYVYRVLAPDYKKTEEVFRVEEAKGYGNSGIEGISWYKDDLILVGTQVGAYLWAYKLDGTPVWRKCMKTVALGMLEIADICYDPIKDQLWIICSETKSIYLFNGDATEHLATYKVPFGGNCESVYLDYNNNCVWIADDDDASELFKIDFTF